MTNKLRWERVDADVVRVSGDIDENADFSALVGELSSGRPVKLNLREVQRINSVGVREWVDFIRAASSAADVTLEECSAAIVTQLNMIANFCGEAKVASIMAPFVCDSCGHEDAICVVVSDVRAVPELASRPCPKCSDSMELDDIPENYFGFALGAATL